ncbi:disease resistance protein RUN1 [Trifolium repens]|nr:disease resistance protein RUN1 [Trifolium repens]
MIDNMFCDYVEIYGQALDVHKNRVTPERLEKWINALTSVADFRGCHIERAKGIYEFQYIYDIIQEVSKHVACSIGLDYRVEKVMRFLTFNSDNDRVCVVGICGAPGIGKTTLARGVYHFHGGVQYDCYWFFDNVGEYLKKHGLVHLQKMLLSEIVGHHNSSMFESVDEGMPTAIKHMLNQKKVFLILEDVHDSEVLKAIVKLTTFFGFGSKVIITAREKCFLELHGIKRIYEVERMNKVEAFQLLNLKAFDSMNEHDKLQVQLALSDGSVIWDPMYLNINHYSNDVFLPSSSSMDGILMFPRIHPLL